MVVVIWLARRFFHLPCAQFPCAQPKIFIAMPILILGGSHFGTQARRPYLGVLIQNNPILQESPGSVDDLGAGLDGHLLLAAGDTRRHQTNILWEAAISKRPSPWLSFCSAQHCHGWCLVASCGSFWQHLCVGPAACFWATSQPMVSIRPFELHPDLALIVRHCHGSLWRSIPFGDVYPLTLIVVVSVVGPKSRCWWRIGANGLTCSFQPRYSSGIAAPVSTSMRSALPRSIAIIVTEVHLRRVTPTTESLQRKGEEAGVPIIRRQLRSWHGAANGLTKRAAWSWTINGKLQCTHSSSNCKQKHVQQLSASQGIWKTKKLRKKTKNKKKQKQFSRGLGG